MFDPYLVLHPLDGRLHVRRSNKKQRGETEAHPLRGNRWERQCQRSCWIATVWGTLFAGKSKVASTGVHCIVFSLKGCTVGACDYTSSSHEGDITNTIGCNTLLHWFGVAISWALCCCKTDRVAHCSTVASVIQARPWVAHHSQRNECPWKHEEGKKHQHVSMMLSIWKAFFW